MQAQSVWSVKVTKSELHSCPDTWHPRASPQRALVAGAYAYHSTLGTSHTKLVVSETVCMCIATYALQKLLQMTQGHNIYIFLRIPN